ncbi:hypothetical protein QM646_06195, partial [Rhodococcus erythropolis]|nr:hypothetical protein [Rhodococcus erythropolis]
STCPPSGKLRPRRGLTEPGTGYARMDRTPTNENKGPDVQISSNDASPAFALGLMAFWPTRRSACFDQACC